MKKLLVLFMLVFYSIKLISQVSLAPNVVFIDKINRSASMMVMNPGEKPKEILISLKFGNPVYDSLGNSTIHYADDNEINPSSATPFTKVFPKKLILQPKEQQTVRFLVSNVGNLAEKMYWSRIIVDSKDITQQIDTTYTDGENINLKTVLETSIVSALFIKIGETTAPIKINGGTTYSDSAKVHLLVDIDKGGNSPYWGTEKLKIYNAKDKLVAEKEGMLVLYFSAKKGYEFNKSDFPPGRYRAEYELANNHPAIPEKYRPKSDPVNASFYFEVKDE